MTALATSISTVIKTMDTGVRLSRNPEQSTTAVRVRTQPRSAGPGAVRAARLAAGGAWLPLRAGGELLAGPGWRLPRSGQNRVQAVPSQCRIRV